MVSSGAFGFFEKASKWLGDSSRTANLFESNEIVYRALCVFSVTVAVTKTLGGVSRMTGWTPAMVRNRQSGLMCLKIFENGFAARRNKSEHESCQLTPNEVPSAVSLVFAAVAGHQYTCGVSRRRRDVVEPSQRQKVAVDDRGGWCRHGDELGGLVVVVPLLDGYCLCAAYASCW